eukprot:108865-Pleurochrysis_carterae.AAC.1
MSSGHTGEVSFNCKASHKRVTPRSKFAGTRPPKRALSTLFLAQWKPYALPFSQSCAAAGDNCAKIRHVCFASTSQAGAE